MENNGEDILSLNLEIMKFISQLYGLNKKFKKALKMDLDSME